MRSLLLVIAIQYIVGCLYMNVATYAQGACSECAQTEGFFKLQQTYIPEFGDTRLDEFDSAIETLRNISLAIMLGLPRHLAIGFFSNLHNQSNILYVATIIQRHPNILYSLKCFVETITACEFCFWLNKVFLRISHSFKQKLIFLVKLNFGKFTKFGQIFKGMVTVQIKNVFFSF